MYRTFASPDSYPSAYNSDIEYPVTDQGVSDAAFKTKADILEGVNGRARIQTQFDNTETQSNAIMPRSELYRGFDLSENVGQGNPGEGNAGQAKHWIRT